MDKINSGNVYIRVNIPDTYNATEAAWRQALLVSRPHRLSFQAVRSTTQLRIYPGKKRAHEKNKGKNSVPLRKTGKNDKNIEEARSFWNEHTEVSEKADTMGKTWKVDNTLEEICKVSGKMTNTLEKMCRNCGKQNMQKMCTNCRDNTGTGPKKVQWNIESRSNGEVRALSKHSLIPPTFQFSAMRNLQAIRS